MKPLWKVEYKFAWRPVLIRNKAGAGPFWPVVKKWVWLKKYTRISFWSESLDRYRTYDTILGHEKIKGYDL